MRNCSSITATLQMAGDISRAAAITAVRDTVQDTTGGGKAEVFRGS